ncbi:MAG: hypothetical protein M3519_05730, partial [Actinomycetota bacterium]|nr:hypothetical protein [Actinomycetota bacterium]
MDQGDRTGTRGLRTREQPAVDGHVVAEGDVVVAKDRSPERRAGAQSRGAAHLPEDVAGLRAVDEAELTLPVPPVISVEAVWKIQTESG